MTDSASDRIPALERQLLDGCCPDVLTAVERLGGLNAQTPRGPSVGLWARVQDFEQEQLDAALRSYALVKANLMRGTVHLVTARQYLTWRRALQPALERTVKQFCPRLWDHVDHDDLLAAGIDLLARRAGSDGMTRGEIGEHLHGAFPQAEAGELGFAIRLLAPVVQVADQTVWRPGRTRYVLAEQVLDEPLMSADDGLADLLRTYVAAYGPVTAADATYYTGLTRLAKPLKDICEVAGGTTRSPVFDVVDREPDVPVPSVVVLPEYDSVYLAHKEGPCRDARRRLIPNPAVDMLGSVLVDGVLVASWRPPRGAGIEVQAADQQLPEGVGQRLQDLQEWSERTSAAVKRGSDPSG